MKKLLVVCMGNICRSPMALVVLRTLVARSGKQSLFSVDSAGTHAGALGERPDPRAEAALLRRGYDLGRIRSRKVSAGDFSKFDLIFAMDANNLSELKRALPPSEADRATEKLHLYLDFGAPVGSPYQQADVPDPYYGNTAGFERVLDLCEIGAQQILNKLVDGSALERR